ncbi:MAG: hypothetical protein EHM72_15220 [Calditrichaeota bacterium]|nr:MAG: hypothetical protein EHM72_15220 [Calditrichota bacterium]
MILKRTAARLYATLSIGVMAFQIALALGAPWGEYAMGGAFPGRFPPALRIGAFVQAIILAGLAAIVLARAGIIPRWSKASKRLVWIVFAFATLSLILNLITPSSAERAVWAPVAFLLLLSSGIVAFSHDIRKN